MIENSVSAQELGAFLNAPIEQAAKALAYEQPPQLVFKKSPEQFAQQIKRTIQQQAQLLFDGMEQLFTILRVRGNCQEELENLREQLGSTKGNLLREDMQRVASGEKSRFSDGGTIRDALKLSESFLDEAFAAAKELAKLDPESSYKVFCSLILIDPNSYGFWLGMSTSSQLCKRYQEAAELYKMTCAKFPWEPLPYILGADCYAASDQPDKEKEMVELFLERFDNPAAFPSAESDQGQLEIAGLVQQAKQRIQ